MIFGPGRYKIYTKNRWGEEMCVALPPGNVDRETDLLAGNQSFMKTITILPAPNGHFFQLSDHPDYSVGCDKEGLKPGARVKVVQDLKQAWAIYPSNEEGSFRIHVADQALCWNIDPNAHYPTPLKLDLPDGSSTQSWKFEKLSD